MALNDMFGGAQTTNGESASEAETSAMDSGTYRLEISTDQPTVGKKIAIGTSNINVIASP